MVSIGRDMRGCGGFCTIETRKSPIYFQRGLHLYIGRKERKTKQGKRVIVKVWPGLYLTCNDLRRCFTNPQGHYVHIQYTIAVEHQLPFALPSRNSTYIFCVCFVVVAQTYCTSSLSETYCRCSNEFEM